VDGDQLGGRGLVAPVVFAVQTVVPIGLAPLVLHTSFIDSPLDGIPLLGCLAVLLAGAITIARSPALLALGGGARAQPAGAGSGSPISPSD